MDNSLSKALIIAGGILLAMVVVGFMMYSFSHLSTWSTTQGEQLSAEQLEKFNKEYEAFDKDLMYGVDVISCLSKAKSNNDKVDDKTYDKSYLITVNVTFKNPLSESVRIYYLPKDAKKESEVTDSTSTRDKLKIQDSSTLKEVFSISDEYIKNIEEFSRSSHLDYNKKLEKNSVNLSLDNSKQSLSTQSGTSKMITALLESSGELKKTVKNNKYDIERNNRTRAEWETISYSMKNRKFQCTNIQYDAQTGRVNLIEFEEY